MSFYIYFTIKASTIYIIHITDYFLSISFSYSNVFSIRLRLSVISNVLFSFISYLCIDCGSENFIEQQPQKIWL